MHEWALAESVVTSLGGKLGEGSEVIVYVGELQNLDRECFDFAVQEILKKEYPGVKVGFHVEGAELECRRCSNRWLFADTKKTLSEQEQEMIHFIPELTKTYLKCPRCGSADYDILKGRGVSVKVKNGS